MLQLSFHQTNMSEVTSVCRDYRFLGYTPSSGTTFYGSANEVKMKRVPNYGVLGKVV